MKKTLVTILIAVGSVLAIRAELPKQLQTGDEALDKLIESAKQHYASNEYDKAIVVLDQVIPKTRVDGPRPDLLLMKVLFQFSKGDFQGALTTCDLLIGMFPEHPAAATARMVRPKIRQNAERGRDGEDDRQNTSGDSTNRANAVRVTPQK